eukprot:m.2704 g.2704  ORF g.2704 m.2704 type:complete len:458 (+) comp8851_c0_seq1:443-1816(+)
MPRKFTWEEVAELNQRSNAHVSYRGKVYDLSKFIDKHPGGIQQILYGAGRDVTQLFEMYHDFKVKQVLEKYYVGDLVSHELPTFAEPGEFAKTLKRRVSDRFKQLGIHPKDATWALARYAIILVLFFIMFYLQTFVLQHSVVGCLAAGVGLACALTMGAFHAVHDASHFAITSKPWVWSLFGCWHDFFNGVSFFVWNHQHTLGHHPYTNIDHADPDVVTAADNLPDIRRIKKSQHWLPRYFYQHLYAPLLYGLLVSKMRLQDFYLPFILKKNGEIRFNSQTPFQLFQFWGGKAFFSFYRVILPYMAGMSLPLLVVQFFVVDIVVSYLLAIVFQVSHVCENVDWPQPDENGVMQCDWWEMQVRTTQDYSTDSWFWTYMTGALNHQTAHHLFPGVAQTHFRVITPIVKQTCEEFGIEYNNCGTFWNAVKSHVNHLKSLGRDYEGDGERKKVPVLKEKGA